MFVAIKLVKMLLPMLLPFLQNSPAQASDIFQEIKSADTFTEYAYKNYNASLMVRWEANGSERAIILAIHGFGLHKFAFKSFAERMQEQGITTYAMDVRGFGAWSEIAANNRELNLKKGIEDLMVTLADLKNSYPDTPIFLLGESMGGAIALHIAANSPDLVAGVVSSVPSGQLVNGKLLKMEIAMKILAKAGGRINAGNLILGKATHDKFLLHDWLSDNDVRYQIRSSEFSQFRKFMRGNDQAVSEIINTPVLMVQGEIDDLVKPSGTVKLFHELATSDKTMLMVKGGEHLTFEEGQFSDKTVATVSAWLSKHIASTNVVASNQ